jgi:hypothetical protein
VKNSNPDPHIYLSDVFRGAVVDAIAFFDKIPATSLEHIERFVGAGVYGIYYCGNFPLYLPISKMNKQIPSKPIYVGKAVPAGWRQGRMISGSTAVLYSRLNQHARSIKQAKNLDLDDFRCKFMVLSGVESDLIVPIEAELIRRYAPLWNAVVDGFGNHDPGKGRYNQSVSEWDVLHPGRDWASRLHGPVPKLEQITKKVTEFLAKR